MPIQMLQWPQKTSYEVHLNQPLKKFIHRTFDNYDKEATEQACKEIDELRRITVNKAMDANQKATETIARYHDQIQLLMSKVPLLENGVAINWNWKDAFDARKQVNHQSGHWELSCVLYNYTVVHKKTTKTVLKYLSSLERSLKAFSEITFSPANSAIVYRNWIVAPKSQFFKPPCTLLYKQL